MLCKQLSGTSIIEIALQNHYLETVHREGCCQVPVCVYIYYTYPIPTFVSTQDPELFTNSQSAAEMATFL